MTFRQTSGLARRDSVVQSLLELIPLFEAEALWESVETIRAVLERVRAWDLAAASRLFLQLDAASAPAQIASDLTSNCIAQRSAAVESLLRSMTVSDLSDCVLEY